MSTWIKTRGTQTGEFGLGFDGPLLKNDSGNLNVRNSSNASFANVHAASFNTTGNVVAGNVLTDNYLYANGAPVDFQQAAGSNSEIQFNLNNDFGASANLTWSASTNTLNATNFSGNGYNLTAINGANIVGNISGNISNANYAAFAGNVVNASQSNITQVGTLVDLTVTGNVSANYYIGNGSLLTGIATGTPNAIVNGTSNVVVDSSGNVRVSVAGVSNTAVFTASGVALGSGASGNITGANLISANFFSGNGSQLFGINAANIVGVVANANYAAFAGNVTGNVQSNITQVGTLSNLSVSGNALITGNLVVDGNLVYVNVENLVVEDPIIELGGGPNGAPLTTNDGKDRGTLLHYYTTAPVDAFMGWDNSNAEFVMGSNVTNSSDVITVNTLGNVRVGNVIGNLTGTASLAVTANTVSDAAQSNITSLGTLTGLNVNGTSNLSAVGNVKITGGNNGDLLTTDGTGNLSFTAPMSVGDSWKADSTTVNFNSGATIAAMTLPAGAVVDKVSVVVDTVFNGTAPTLTVGLQGGSGFEYVAANDVNLKSGDRYDVPSQIAPVGGSGNIQILYTADGSGAGAARVIVTYANPV